MDKYIRAYYKNECLYDFQFMEVENPLTSEQKYVDKLPNENAIVYVSHHNLDKLINEIYYSRKKYVILVECGDISLVRMKYVPYNVYKIYSTNIDIISEFYEFFPFGILPGHFNAIRKCEKEVSREDKIFVAFNRNSYRERPLYLENLMKISSAKLIYHPLGESWNSVEYFEMLWKYNFTAAPRGNAIDTYRKYEALHSYCIPIVQPNITNTLSPFPLIFTDDNFNITEESLYEQYNSLKCIDNTKLHCEFWRKKMESDFN